MKPRTLAIAVVALAGFAACSSSPRLRHASADEFLSRANEIRKVNSAHWACYVGVSHARAYLEYGDAIGSSGEGSTIVYWTEFDGLPEDIATKLREGVDPWTSEAGGTEDDRPIPADAASPRR